MTLCNHAMIAWYITYRYSLISSSGYPFSKGAHRSLIVNHPKWLLNGLPGNHPKRLLNGLPWNHPKRLLNGLPGKPYAPPASLQSEPGLVLVLSLSLQMLWPSIYPGTSMIAILARNSQCNFTTCYNFKVSRMTAGPPPWLT